MKKILIALVIICKISFSQIITIPTVFHVLYSTSQQNVADTNIIHLLQNMNYDYTDTTCQNTFAKDVNTGIQFVLATQDPNGNPTNGIIHKQTTQTSFTTDNKVMSSAQGGDDIWDRKSYLNIYVCNLGGGLLGYAQYPCSTIDSLTDAAVVHYGILNGNISGFDKTATHEIAHWFGVYHNSAGSCNADIDSVSDTPALNTNPNCGSASINSCSGLADSILAKNFMSYTSDESCMCFFTPGQKLKMWNTINNCPYRTSLKNSSGATVTNETFVKNDLLFFPNPSAGVFEIKFFILPYIKIAVYNSFGQKIFEATSKERKSYLDLSSQPNGIYMAEITSDDFKITKQLVVIH